MVKEEKGEGVSRSTRNAYKRKTTNSKERMHHNTTARGRPRKEKSGISPYAVQKQFTQDFVEFSKQYLEWKLNENYIWTSDFDKRSPTIYQKLSIANPKHQQAIDAIIVNMNNMMEHEVGKQFRQVCMIAYEFLQKGESLFQVQERLVDKILTEECFSFLRLKNQLIPIQRRVVKQQVLKNFFRLIVELIYKVAEKDDQQPVNAQKKEEISNKIQAQY